MARGRTGLLRIPRRLTFLTVILSVIRRLSMTDLMIAQRPDAKSRLRVDLARQNGGTAIPPDLKMALIRICAGADAGVNSIILS